MLPSPFLDPHRPPLSRGQLTGYPWNEATDPVRIPKGLTVLDERTFILEPHRDALDRIERRFEVLEASHLTQRR